MYVPFTRFSTISEVCDWLSILVSDIKVELYLHEPVSLVIAFYREILEEWFRNPREHLVI